MNQELRALGMLDDERMLVRARYLGFSIAFLILAALLVIPGIFLSGQYRGLALLIAGAVVAVAVLGFIFYGVLTPLSNEGVRHAERWRAYQKHLKEVARGRVQLTSTRPHGCCPSRLRSASPRRGRSMSRSTRWHSAMVPRARRCRATTAGSRRSLPRAELGRTAEGEAVARAVAAAPPVEVHRGRGSPARGSQLAARCS